MRFLKYIEPYFEQRSFLLFLLLIVLVVGLIIRIVFAKILPHPGGSDYAFYYTVAENIVDGRGFQVDFIGNYLSNPETISHSSNDYWMPLTSLIISLPMFVYGKSLFVALLPSIVISLIISVMTYFWGKSYSESDFIAYCSACLILIIPPLFHYSLRTDSTVYYVLFAFSSLLFMVSGWEKPRFFLLSAVFAGLAHLTRQDGILLLLVLLTVILITPMNKKVKFLYFFLAIVVYLIVLSLLLVSNYKTFGLLFPPGPLKTMFLTNYEDIYSYSKELTLSAYLDWGLSNILVSKIMAFLANIRTLYRYLGEIVSVFTIVGVVFAIVPYRSSRKWRMCFPFLTFLGALLALYSLIVTFPGFGGFARSSIVVIPFLLVIAIDAIRRSIGSNKIVLAIVIFVGLMYFIQSVRSARETIEVQIQVGRELSALKVILTDDAQAQNQQDVVIMTRNPWMVYYATRYKTIQIPNEDIETIYKVAQKYRANYLLLPAPREAFEDLYTGEEVDDRFRLVQEVPNSELKLFRIHLNKAIQAR